MERISSRQNPIVKRFRSLAESSSEHVLLDGAHLLEEALASGIDVEVVAIADEAPAGASALAETARRAGAKVVPVSAAVLGAISPVRQPTGIVAIAKRRAVPLDRVFERSPQMVLMLCDVQDPGNVGAIIRAADACGATGVITSEATADPFGWKALRGSMGSAFRIPVAPRHALAAAATAAKAHGVRLYAAVPRGGTPLPRCELRRPAAVLLGGEGAGLPADLTALSDERLTIPMRAEVESLNVAAAAALVVYEAQRQRDGAGA